MRKLLALIAVGGRLYLLLRSATGSAPPGDGQGSVCRVLPAARAQGRASRARRVRPGGRDRREGEGSAGGTELPPDDVTLARNVESEIFSDSEVPKGQINVNAENGKVYLRGEVGQPELIRDLEERARSVQGVRTWRTCSTFRARKRPEELDRASVGELPRQRERPPEPREEDCDRGGHDRRRGRVVRSGRRRGRGADQREAQEHHPAIDSRLAV